MICAASGIEENRSHSVLSCFMPDLYKQKTPIPMVITVRGAPTLK